MNKKRNVGNLLPLIAAIFAIVAIFCAMAPGFSEASRGTGFIVMFGNQSNGKAPVAGLIVAFIVEILVAVVALASMMVKGKGKFGLMLFVAAGSIAAAVLFLFAKNLYISANASVDPIIVTDFKLGAGFITSIVFDFLAAAAALLKVWLDNRKDED